MAVFPSEQWVDDLAGRVNASADYRRAAATWEGDIAFVIGAEPDRGVREDVWVRLDLWHGECRAGGIVAPDDGARCRYVLRAPYSRWKEVVRGRLDPIKAMLQGKLKLQGDLPTIVRHVRAANELVRITSSVPTEFVDEPARA